MSKALVVLSGGQDSTTCLFWAMRKFSEVHAVTFDYNQRHDREIDAAIEIGERAGVASHEIIHMGPILAGTSPLVSNDHEVEQYADHGSLPGGLEKTFVPMRNQLFLTVAANRAYVLGCNDMVTGVCQEDFGGYPDCRRTFIDALEKAMFWGTFTGKDGAPYGINIHTPLMNLTKADSVKMALEMGRDCWNALAHSHTAYDGAYPPIGHDHATLLRQKGFEEAGVPDPLILRAVGEGLMKLPTAENYKVYRKALNRTTNKDKHDEAFDETFTDVCAAMIGGAA
jgi:7-cyano-7-deazaguanine synthase